MRSRPSIAMSSFIVESALVGEGGSVGERSESFTVARRAGAMPGRWRQTRTRDGSGPVSIPADQAALPGQNGLAIVLRESETIRSPSVRRRGVAGQAKLRLRETP